MGVYRVQIGGAFRTGHDECQHGFAKIWMWNTDHRAFQHPLLRVQHRLYFLGVDVKSAGNDQVFVAPNNMDISIGINHAQIPSDEKPIAAQLFGSFLGHIPIALEDICSAHFDLANIPLGQCFARGAVSDFQLNPRKRKSDCTCTARALIGIRGAHIRFCHAVALQDAMTAALFKQLMRFRQKRRAARDKEPHVPGQIPVEAWIIKQPGVKGRHAHHRGCLWQ